VAAPKKTTPEMETEILRRRTAGECITAIATDFDIAHQTLSKLAKRAERRTTELDRQSQATPESERQAPQKRTPNRVKRVVRRPLPDRLRQPGGAPRLLRTAQARIQHRFP
jgi:hypothetical protein